jgi:GxxExxY protein
LESEVREFDEVSRAVIGAAIEVHRVLGPGFRESVYQKALEREFELRGIQFRAVPRMPVSYKGMNVGTHAPDFVVQELVAVELKAVEAIADVHVSQLVSSMRATGLRIGLVLNFSKGTMKEGIRRVVL